MNKNRISPFNSSLESGVRALSILTTIYPKTADLQRLVEFDYLVVHSGDANGPESLHAPLPMRAGELLVRRGVIEAGLILMMSRALVIRIPTEHGIEFMAGENASAFVNSFNTPYLKKLIERSQWVASEYGEATEEEVRSVTRQFFDKWTTQFHAIKGSLGDSYE
ncbi:MAG: threonine transporter [gamma proteobacterium symbiont of Ctena orbiculata]|nr:MAG: threonine transporter [gamma proteobacterium symbiont of Ctena orbiculata]